MAKQGKERLFADLPDYRGPGRYPIAAYSEFMPPPRVGWHPYDAAPPAGGKGDSPHFVRSTLRAVPANGACPLFRLRWRRSLRLASKRAGRDLELQPGLQLIARQVLSALMHLDREQSAQGISREKWRATVIGRRNWPNCPAHVPHERYVIFMPLAFSLTKDDKGRVRWTLFGSSEQGPARFLEKLFHSPGRSGRPKKHVISSAGC